MYDRGKSSLAGAAIAGLALLAMPCSNLENVSQCESQKNDTPEEQKNEKDEEDPYENLPEDDEETNCTLCNTFRKGPCRPYWRKLERCFKDHENQENGATKCMKYFSPHQECLQKYTNLYHLVSLEMKQDLVHDAERAVSAHERRSWQPKVDWTEWKRFVKDPRGGLSFRQTIPSRDKTKPLWQRLPPETEPVLLTVTCPIPRRQTKPQEMILKIAYAVDQDGMVLGFSYNQEYLDLIEQATKTSSADTTNAEDVGTQSETEAADDGDTKNSTSSSPVISTGDKEECDPNIFEVDFFLLPGETRKVKICAMYAEDPTKASPEKDILDALLYSSPSYSLAEALL